MVMKKRTLVQATLVLSYEDRKGFADFFNILMVVEKRVQARKKECKNKNKSVQVKARDPCGPYLLFSQTITIFSFLKA